MKLRKPTTAGDPLDIPANGIRRSVSIPLSWVVAWSRHGIDPVEAAWHESHSPKNMVTVLVGCGRWNARMNLLLGYNPLAYGETWPAAEELVKRAVDGTEYRMRAVDSWWKTPGGTPDAVLHRVMLETAIAERLLANKIHRAISPPGIQEIMACVRDQQAKR